MNKGKHIFLICVCLYVYTIRGSISGLEISMNYVIWFSVMYIIGAYLRIYYDELPDVLINPRKNWSVILIAITVSITSILCGVDYFVKHGVEKYHYYLSDSNKILAVTLAVVTFLFFKSHTIKYSKIINSFGGATFGVLLIHANSDAMRKWLWGFVDPVHMYESVKIYYESFVSVILIFFVCSLIDLIRIKLIEKPIFNLLEDKLDIIENSIKSLIGIK